MSAHRTDALERRAGELLAALRHLAENVRREREAHPLTAYPEVRALADEAEATLERQAYALEAWLEWARGRGGSTLRRAVAHVGEAVAGWYARLRDHAVSRFLRHLGAGLSGIVLAYEVVHTAALAHHEPRLARIALSHLGELAPLVERVRLTAPHAVAREASRDDGADEAVAAEADRNLRRAWSSVPADAAAVEPGEAIGIDDVG